MLGSADEAEDLVQETYLRAWRSYGTFEGRSSVRVWLYRIATNACLSALAKRERRELPSGLGGPGDDPDGPPGPPDPAVAWLQPIRTPMTSDAEDPAAIVAAREGVRLALIAGLQYLPPRQRAVLILRDVLAFPAAEVAAMLGTSVAGVKSALQRARARLDEVAPARGEVIEPTDPHARALLDQYVAGFENADTAAAYHRDDHGLYRAFGLGVLTVTTTGITRVTVFAGGPGLLTKFGLPLPASTTDRAR